MAQYDNYSEYAPSNFTGSLSQSLIERVHNNPANADAHKVNFPQYYDEFINKTEGNSSSPVPVIAEEHNVSELYYEGGKAFLYLHHVPVQLIGSSIQVSDGALNTGATDYSLGVIVFDTPPTDTFYVNYLARADFFAAEHINAIQNSIMSMQRLMGAGTVSGEGIRNAEFWLDSYPPGLTAKLPNSVNVRDLDRDVEIKGGDSETVNITLGNGSDTITLDSSYVNFTSTDAGQAISGDFGNGTDDLFRVNCPVHINNTGSVDGLLPTGQFAAAAFSVGDPLDSTWTGASPGPYVLPYPDTGVYPIARFYGDVQIVGDLFLSGVVTALASATGVQMQIIQENLLVGNNLIVSGNSTLGTSSTNTVSTPGALNVGRYIHVQGLSNDVSRFDTSIWMKNQGNANNGLGGPYADAIVPRGTKWLADLPYHLSRSSYTNPGTQSDLSVNKISHVDGLDPSYISKGIVHRAINRSDFQNNCVNLGAFNSYNGMVTSVSAPGTSQWRDTGLAWPSTALSGWTSASGFTGGANLAGTQPFRWHHMGGDYYHGKFGNESHAIPSGEYSGTYQYGDGTQWHILWTNNDTTQSINPGAMKYGARIPLSKITVDYYTGSPYVATGVLVQMSRSFNTPVQVGDSYQLYHPLNTPGNILQKVDAQTIRVYASEAEPVIATINGVNKVLTTPCDESAVNDYTGLHYVFLDGRTPEIAKQYAGYALEAEPTISVKTNPSRDESQVLVGEFYSELPGPGINSGSIITYRYNGKYDTLWMRAMADENLYENNATEFSYRANERGLSFSDTGSIESPAAYVTGLNFGDILCVNTGEYRVRIQHNLGSMDKVLNSDLRVYVAPNLGEDYSGHGTGSFREGPDTPYIQELENIKYKHISTDSYSCYEVVRNQPNYTDIVLYELDKIPGALISARAEDGDRDIVLTGGAGSTALTNAGISERERRWFWVRATIG
jgi:hypothetical protein